MDLKREFDTHYKLMFISKSLKIYEKIAIIFLLCAKPHIGLKIIDILLTTVSKTIQNKVFFTWAKKQMLFSFTDWTEKFAEILAVIQNYRLVNYLGYNPNEFKTRFKTKKNIYFDEVKVVLYRLCEELNKSQTQRIIASIESDNSDNKVEIPDRIYLEKYILEWCKRNIISIDNNKKINLGPLIQYVELFKLNEIMADMKTVIETSHYKAIKNIKAIQLQSSLSDYYNILDKTNVGMCVIINEKRFPNSPLKLKPRWGSNKDVERLKEVFTAFGFRIKVHTDITYDKLISLLFVYAKLVPVTDSFFTLIILSHGSENVIYTSDSVPVPMSEIEMIFQAENCPSLLGKPKIFIIQSCQGQNWQKCLQGIEVQVETEDIEVDTSEILPKNDEMVLVGPQKGDSIIAWSTVQGYASFRDKHNGSWYIEELCKELWKFGHIADFVEILTLVNNNLRSKRYDGQFMVPSLLSSLSGKIQFPFVEENWLKGKEMMFKRLFFELYFTEFINKAEVSPVDVMKLQMKN